LRVRILKHASKSRPSGEWSDDDYDVFDGEQRIGRIMWTHAEPGVSGLHLRAAHRYLLARHNSFADAHPI